MRIINLQAENIKRLKAVEITPDGNVIVVSGRNGAGKTSVLDSIWLALGGGPAAKGTTQPIREGQGSAEVRLDLGDLVVTRSWKGDKTTLKVENGAGAKFDKPQTMLDSLIGRLSFDPLEFAHQDEKSQLKTLMELVELPFDPDELAARRKELFDTRTDTNRELSSLKARSGAMMPFDPDCPTTEISAADIVAEIEAAQKHNETVKAARNYVSQVDDAIEAADKRVADLAAQLRAAEAVLSEAYDQVATATADLGKLAAPIDITVLTEKLGSVETINRQIREQKSRVALDYDLATLTERSESLTEQIELIDTEKEKAIASAAFPLDGLSFNDLGVLFGGVPFQQCSAGEQLRVSVALAMAVNPTIRVIRITDGSLLDSTNMTLIAQMADENDYQVWIERVDESGVVGIYIEDGEVV